MAANQKEILLYYYTKPATYVKRDIEMLQDKYEVKGFSFYHKSKWYTPLLFLSQFIFILKNHSHSRLTLCMFAGYHSFLPALVAKIYAKPFIIILGGTDSVTIPEIGYGILRKGLIRKFALWSYKLTSHFAPVHQSLIYSQNIYYGEKEQLQGIKHYLPGIKADFMVIPNGYDPQVLKPAITSRTKNSFITVAFDLHKPHLFKLKGIDLIMAIAPSFPDCQFTIVGLNSVEHRPANVVLLAPMNQQELIKELSKHEFYFQLSLSEGFPNALCEAMLCSCIPVVSNVASMPEIVGDTGFVLKKRDPILLEVLLKKDVLNCNRAILSAKAREKIIAQYHKDIRKENFYKLFEKVS